MSPQPTQQPDCEESRMLSPHPPRNHDDHMHQPSAHLLFLFIFFSMRDFHFKPAIHTKVEGVGVKKRKEKRESAMMAMGWISNCAEIQMIGFDGSLV